MKIRWNPMKTCPRKEGDKVVILLKFGFPFDREETILPMVAEWQTYTEGGKNGIPLGFWRMLPHGFTTDSRNSEELGWRHLEDFIP